MARIFAGVLGPLALLISLARGAIHAWDVETTVLYAWISLWGFAALGAVLGWLAGRIVEDDLRTRISADRKPPAETGPTQAA